MSPVILFFSYYCYDAPLLGYLKIASMVLAVSCGEKTILAAGSFFMIYDTNKNTICGNEIEIEQTTAKNKDINNLNTDINANDFKTKTTILCADNYNKNSSYYNNG